MLHSTISIAIACFRPFVAVLFKSFNVEEMYRLLVLDEPYRTKDTNERNKEVSTVGRGQPIGMQDRIYTDQS
jgi:hypothetical protein